MAEIKKKGRPTKPKEIKADNLQETTNEIVKTSKRKTPANLEGGSTAKKMCPEYWQLLEGYKLIGEVYRGTKRKV